MENLHTHETLVEAFDYHGAVIDLVSWQESLWCGKIGYAVNNTDEPDVDRIAAEMAEAVKYAPNMREADWETCLSFHYLSDSRPNGVMFAFRVETGDQPEIYDVVRVPAGQYMRIKLCEETYRALGVEPWTGGIPPYEWIGKLAAPRFGYTYGDDSLPIVEYYQFESGQITACYLYVPVRKAA